MITFGKTASKPNFMFGKLPRYFKENDGGSKVVSGYEGEGTLERYLEIFCTEIDNEVSPYIDEVLSITDAEALAGLTRVDPTELLIHISELFGNPPDVGIGTSYSGNEDEYIVLIRYIRHILQRKGTELGLEYYLNIYGYTVSTLTESGITTKSYDESPTPLKYDDGTEYDVGFTFFSGFDLVITDVAGTGTKSPPQAWLDNYLKPAIQKFIAPMWATLGTITYS